MGIMTKITSINFLRFFPGDIGRSPRMCNHSVSLANVGFDVTLMGYDQGSNLIESVRNSPKISVSPIRTYPQWMSNWMPRPVSLILKAIWQFVTLFFFALPHKLETNQKYIINNSYCLQIPVKTDFRFKVCVANYVF